MVSKKELSERDICTKYITPALLKAGWDSLTQIREEVSFTDGRIYVKGNLTSRGNVNVLITFYIINPIYLLQSLKPKITSILLKRASNRG